MLIKNNFDGFITQAQQGDESAKNYIAKNFRDLFFRMARSYGLSYEDSEDTAQEACLRAMKTINNYEVGTNLRAWLTRIFISCLSDLFRSSIVTDFSNKFYSQWIIDFIYLVTPKLRDLINELISATERDNLFNEIINDLANNTYYKFMNIKYENYKHNEVLKLVKEWLSECVGVKLITFSDLATEDNGKAYFVENIPDMDPQNDPEKSILDQELSEKVNQYIARLHSDLQKFVVRLYHLEGVIAKKIAEMLGKTPNAISQLLDEARKNLRTMMSQDDFFEDYVFTEKSNS